MYQLCFYVPESHLEQVKDAVFRAGGGKYKAYDQAAWQTSGTGQFCPLDGAQPFIGRTGQVERVEEYKVELIVQPEFITPVVKALLESHPYEEPAYTVIGVIDPKMFTG
jgi:hypothetical protein